MKRILAMLLILSMVLVFIPACADEETSGLIESSKGLTFKLNDDEKSYTLIGIGSCTEENIVIDSYAGYPVTEIAKSALMRATNMKTLTIGDSVVVVGEVAFYGCENLSSVSIGKGVITIGKNAFENCTSLEQIVIPEGIDEIPMRAFAGCTSLKSVSMSDDVTEIRGYAFENCTALSTITIPKNMKYIRDYSFKGCTGLVEVINHSSIEIVKNSDKNGGIAYYALNVHNGESELIYKDDFIFYSVDKSNYLVKYTGDKAEVALPDDFEGEAYAIAPYAFSNNTKITAVKLGAKTSAIANNVFEGATALSKVELSSGVLVIGEAAFSSCVALDKIDIPQSVQGIGVNAFAGCAALESVTVSANLKIIGKNAFEGCGNLKSAVFEQTEGWKAGETDVPAEELVDTAKAAECLTKTYVNVSWGR